MTVLLLPDQVMERTRLARSTLSRLRVHGGGPPFIKLGAKVLYPADEFEKWLADQPRRRSTSDEPSP